MSPIVEQREDSLSTEASTPSREVPMVRSTRFASFALALLLVAAPGLLSAQDGDAPARSHTSGLVLNLHLQGGALSTDAGTNNGGGGGLMVGYGVSRKVLIFLQWDGSEIDLEDEDLQGSYGLGHGDLGVRYSFANQERAFIPYLTGAFTGLWAGAEIANRDVSLSGGGIRLGGGFGYYFIRQLALDVGLSFTFGSFSNLKIENVTLDVENVGVTTSRLEVGLSWYPQG